MPLDFSLVRELDSPTMWFSLPRDLESRLTLLPEVQARALAAIHFAFKVTIDRDHLGTTEAHETVIREAYLRAALAEFASLDEAADKDFEQLPLAGQAPRQALSLNPLVHAFRLLRHLNTHLSRSSFTVNSRRASIELGNQIHEVDYHLWLVNGFSASALGSLRNARYYAPSELDALAEWFNAEQREWGAPHMLLLATRCYCEQLVACLPSAV